jgi:hypothetical protein
MYAAAERAESPLSRRVNSAELSATKHGGPKPPTSPSRVSSGTFERFGGPRRQCTNIDDPMGVTAQLAGGVEPSFLALSG